MVDTSQRTWNRLDFMEEEGRQKIFHWSERRERKYKGFRKSYNSFRIFAFNTNLLKSFIENFNFMVILQMLLAGLVTYACKSLNIVYDVHVSLFISPIVFPLAFSINTDFQRREKVLEDLANFKSSAMMWLFCIRDWREPCNFDENFLKTVGNKIKGMLFHLREYLLTEKLERRKFIARVIYEDLSDTNQINEKVRRSELNANSPLLSRIIHFLNMMCLAYERLRVVREYRSPRSIRSFTKVLIFALPILLSPYYVYLGDRSENSWSPYYISVMVSFVFGALQGVQDKLDDPFDGMSEDDIKLDHLDEWTFQSLEATVHRTYKIGRFQVVANPDKDDNAPASAAPSATVISDEMDGTHLVKKKSSHLPVTVNRSRPTVYNVHSRPTLIDRLIPHHHKHSTAAKSPMRSPRSIYSETDDTSGDDFELHPYAGVLHNIKGNATILRGGHIKQREKSFDDLNSLNSTLTRISQSPVSNHLLFGGGGESSTQKNRPLQSIFTVSNPDEISININETPLTMENPIATSLLNQESSVPSSGVASYLGLHVNGVPSISRQSASLPITRNNSHDSMSSMNSIRSRKSPVHFQDHALAKRPQFVMGYSSTASNSSANISPRSQFNDSKMSASSTRPLLIANLSTDSDTLSSGDDETKRPLTINGDVINDKSKSTASLPMKSRFSVSSSVKTRPLQHAKSENGLVHQLKDEEVFI